MNKNHLNIQKELEKSLFQSEAIRNSRNTQLLLTYLLQCQDKGIVPKETMIAREVFGKDQHFNPGEDPLVRVHIHNLRKKLEEYYREEGRKDRYRLEIPKGQYVIHIIDQTESKQIGTWIRAHTGWLQVYPLLLVLMTCIASGLLIYAVSLHKEVKKYRCVDIDDAIWGDFLKSRNETMIVCGDHFFYNININYQNRSVHIRDTWINSAEDMKYLIFPDNTTTAQPSDQTYFPFGTVWSLPSIVKLLNSSPRQIVLRSSSQLTPNVIEEQNVVYIGNIKSLGILQHYIEQAHLAYDIRQRILYHFSPADTLRFNAEANEDVYHTDYAFIIKYEGPRGNAILITAGFFTIGLKEACRYLTEPELLPQLEQLLITSCGRVPKNFLVVLKVSGIRQAIIESRFALVEALTPVNSPAPHSAANPLLSPVP
ncbi:MAG TPA: hypothetical protein PKI62_04515 [bacterium]|nr:hypothetical protein [bacterium]HPR87955.1 hypothetical protein [bacterium]